MNRHSRAQLQTEDFQTYNYAKRFSALEFVIFTYKL
jgi:hypothetical protein